MGCSALQYADDAATELAQALQVAGADGERFLGRELLLSDVARMDGTLTALSTQAQRSGSTHCGHTRQESTMHPTATLSPTLCRVTLPPTRDTRPTISCPGTQG